MSFPIVFSVDRNAVTGLHVTLATMLAHAGAPLDLTIFHQDLKQRDIKKLERTCAKFHGSVATVNFARLEISQFSTLRGLHGNRVPFSKFILPNVVDDDVFCYLDADLYVGLDIVSVFKSHDRSKSLSAVATGSRETSIEKPLFEQLDFDLMVPYFNTGVVIFSADRFRERNVSRTLIDIANEYNKRLKSADQTAFNILHESEPIGMLPSKFNIVASPYQKVTFTAEMQAIFHFVGSPKPWDPFGRRLHPNFAIFEHGSRRAGITPRSGLDAVNVRSIIKTIRTSRSLIRRFKLDRYIER